MRKLSWRSRSPASLETAQRRAQAVVLGALFLGVRAHAWYRLLGGGEAVDEGVALALGEDAVALDLLGLHDGVFEVLVGAWARLVNLGDHVGVWTSTRVLQRLVSFALTVVDQRFERLGLEQGLDQNKQ